MPTPTQVSKGRKKRTATDITQTNADLHSSLLDLIRLRVAQIHGCSWSVQEQIIKLKDLGETDRRLRLLKRWRSEAVFSLREMVALNLAEALSSKTSDSNPESALHIASFFFNETAMIRLTLVILAVNDWHYLNDSFEI